MNRQAIILDNLSYWVQSVHRVLDVLESSARFDRSSTDRRRYVARCHTTLRGFVRDLNSYDALFREDPVFSWEAVYLAVRERTSTLLQLWIELARDAGHQTPAECLHPSAAIHARIQELDQARDDLRNLLNLHARYVSRQLTSDPCN